MPENNAPPYIYNNNQLRFTYAIILIAGTIAAMINIGLVSSNNYNFFRDINARDLYPDPEKPCDISSTVGRMMKKVSRVNAAGSISFITGSVFLTFAYGFFNVANNSDCFTGGNTKKQIVSLTLFHIMMGVAGFGFCAIAIINLLIINSSDDSGIYVKTHRNIRDDRKKLKELTEKDTSDFDEDELEAHQDDIEKKRKKIEKERSALGLTSSLSHYEYNNDSIIAGFVTIIALVIASVSLFRLRTCMGSDEKKYSKRTPRQKQIESNQAQNHGGKIAMRSHAGAYIVVLLTCIASIGYTMASHGIGGSERDEINEAYIGEPCENAKQKSAHESAKTPFNVLGFFLVTASMAAFLISMLMITSNSLTGFIEYKHTFWYMVLGLLATISGFVAGVWAFVMGTNKSVLYSEGQNISFLGATGAAGLGALVLGIYTFIITKMNKPDSST